MEMRARDAQSLADLHHVESQLASVRMATQQTDLEQGDQSVNGHHSAVQLVESMQI